MGIGVILRNLLKDKGAKNKDLAEHMGVSASRLSNYMTEKRTPDIETLSLAADFFAVPLETFMPRIYADEAIKRRELDNAKENRLSYSGFSRDIINVPYQKINAKKNSLILGDLPLSSKLFSNIEEPEKNLIAFLVTPYCSTVYAKDGDYIVCVKGDGSSAKNDDSFMLNGRYPKFYKYHTAGNIKILIDKDGKRNIVISDISELELFYKVLFFIAKP